jgi:hypothetical protein
MTFIYNICIIYKMPSYKRSKSQKKNGGSRSLRRSRSAKRGGRRATKSSRGGQRAKIGGAGGMLPNGIRQTLSEFIQGDFDSKMYKYFGNEIQNDKNFTTSITKDELKKLVDAKLLKDPSSEIQLDFATYIK